MNRPFKLSSAKTKILWISDQHQQHEPNWAGTPPLWKSRGFTSIVDHDSWLRDQWFKLVDADTVVFDLGDRVFSDPKGDRFRETTTWPGKQYIVNGNHVSGHRQIYQEGVRGYLEDIGANAAGTCDVATLPLIYPIKFNNLTFIGDYMIAYIDGVSVFMQHYPLYIWPELSAEGIHLHGHCHRRALDLNPEAQTHGKVCDIGLDNAIAYNGTPFFSWPEIVKIMATKPVAKRDHH
jgi:calcineurin-like phosphoesterase family protein